MLGISVVCPGVRLWRFDSHTAPVQFWLGTRSYKFPPVWECPMVKKQTKNPATKKAVVVLKKCEPAKQLENENSEQITQSIVKKLFFLQFY